MATVTVENPEKMVRKKVDGSGKVYLSNKWAGQEVSLVVEAVDETDKDDT